MATRYKLISLKDKATGAEVDTATDDVKYATAKAIKDSHNVPSVAPSTDGKVLTSNGTDWVSETPDAVPVKATGAEVDTGTDDAKFVTPKAVEDSKLIASDETVTLTNKRITSRAGTTTSHATPTINTDNVDFYSLTAQTEDITSFTTNLSGTPTERQTLWIAITGTAARGITWGTSFEASTVALPTTTVTTARLDVGFIWNTVTSKWRCVASG